MSSLLFNGYEVEEKDEFLILKKPKKTKRSYYFVVETGFEEVLRSGDFDDSIKRLYKKGLLEAGGIWNPDESEKINEIYDDFKGTDAEKYLNMKNPLFEFSCADNILPFAVYNVINLICCLGYCYVYEDNQVTTSIMFKSEDGMSVLIYLKLAAESG